MLERLETPTPSYLRGKEWPEYGTREYAKLEELRIRSKGITPCGRLPRPRIHDKKRGYRWPVWRDLSGHKLRVGLQLHNRTLVHGPKYHWVNIGMAITAAWHDALRWFVRLVNDR